MSEFEPRAVIESALSVLVDGLEPVVRARFAKVAPQVPEWTEIIAVKDRQSGRYVDRYNTRDLSILLRAMTESFGALEVPEVFLRKKRAVRLPVGVQATNVEALEHING
mgnify:CR=1 FL=1